MGSTCAQEIDWLGFSRRAAAASRDALARFPEHGQRAERLGRGQGGDMTLGIDRAVEDVIFAELNSLGAGLVAISEERGRVELHGGGELVVVIDPIDGSLNAKRALSPFGISLAVAHGQTIGDVEFGYVGELGGGGEWWAERGVGAYQDGRRLQLGRDPALEVLGVESADPQRVEAAAADLVRSGAYRLRMVGSIAVSLCNVASAGFDGLVSLRAARSVDVAAGQLIAREAGASVSFPDAGGESLSAGLSLEMRSRVVAGASAPILSRLLDLGLSPSAGG
ncbi:MAG: inorganic polyphosphate/ATP-NAD kinase (Poly(P)/ATP NAD kinase) [Thermoleophilaceae bacterium]